jgi:hypothetical protein
MIDLKWIFCGFDFDLIIVGAIDDCIFGLVDVTNGERKM